MTPDSDQPEPGLPESIPEPYGHSIRRILVALDASRHSQAVLETAAGLAARLHSEIEGLFVEDINLLRLEDLPFVREVRFQQVIARQFESGEMQRKLRARAALVRHEFEETAERYQIQCRFRVVRGSVDSELMAAALEADLLAVGQLGHSVSRRTRLGSTARAAVARASSAVLLVRPGYDISRPVLILYDGSEVSNRALAVAASLAGESNELRVLIWGVNDDASYEARQRISTLLEPAGIKAEYQHFKSRNPAEVLALMKRQSVGLLVIGTTDARLPNEVFQKLLEEAAQHILVVR
jgi:nucleotide-binding universal stress UspA family protein